MPGSYLPVEAELAQTRWFAGHCRMFMARLRKEEDEMRPEDLMKPDLSSEIVLLGSGGLIFVSLLLIVAAALTRA